MSEYHRAFADMAAEPPEIDEPAIDRRIYNGGRREGAGRKAGAGGVKVKIAITVDPAVLEWLDIEADNRDMSRSEYINSLLRSAYDAGK